MRECTVPLAKGISVSCLAHFIARELKKQEHLDTRLLKANDGSWIVQAQSTNEQILRWIGLGRNLTIMMIPAESDCVTVQTASGNRSPRSVLVFTGVFIICWPLAITAVIGAIRNQLLIRRIYRLLRNYSQ